MKDFGKKILKYVIFAAVVYIVTVVAMSSLKAKTFGFDPKYLTDSIVIVITFFACAGYWQG